MGKHEINKVREIALAFPEVNEKSSPGGAISFIILNKITLCYYHESHHNDRVSLWCPAYPDLKKDLIRIKPEHYFQPKTSADGHFAEWLGVYLDSVGENSVDWKLTSKILEDAFRKIAPKRLIDKL